MRGMVTYKEMGEESRGRRQNGCLLLTLLVYSGALWWRCSWVAEYDCGARRPTVLHGEGVVMLSDI